MRTGTDSAVQNMESKSSVEEISPNSAAPPFAASSVLVVDSHPALRLGISALMRRMGQLTACCEAGDAAEAWQIFDRCRPDMIVMDVSLPDGDGIELARRMMEAKPGLAVLILSHHDEPLFAARALAAGALGYVKKDEGLKELAQALGKVALRQRYLSRCFRSHVLLKILMHSEGNSPGLLAPLSKRETDVFRCLGQGMGSQEIAGHLELGIKTVDTHRANIKRKLNLADAASTSRLAEEWHAMESASPSAPSFVPLLLPASSPQESRS